MGTVMTDRIFIPPTTFPAEYVTRIGVKAVILTQAPNDQYVGYFLFSDGDIWIADWDSNGRSHPNKEESCNDLFSIPKDSPHA